MILSYSLPQFKMAILAGSKIHTIREDIGNRWKVGRNIQHWMHNPRNLSKKPHQFDLGHCAGIQKIEINPLNRSVKIDGRKLSEVQIKVLAFNDGFDNVTQFWLWFIKPFTGKIIHFTYLKY